MFNRYTPAQFNRSRLGGSYVEFIDGVTVTVTNTAEGKTVSRGGNSVSVASANIDGNSAWLRNAVAAL